MKTSITELKSKLSEHVRLVRSGREFVVYDRREPVARLSPYEKGLGEVKLDIRPAKRPLVDMKLSFKLKTDPGEMQREEQWFQTLTNEI